MLKVKEALGELFPTKLTVFVFFGYMALFINLGQLVTASKGEDGKLHYNPVTVVLLTETLKLFVAAGIYMSEGNSFSNLLSQCSTHRQLWLYYFVPASLYALYNILQYYNLQNYDPTTYFLLLQLRVVVTGLVYQFLFKRQLSQIQWVSLLMLTAGCVVKQYDWTSGAGLVVNQALMLIFVQVFASCFAGVYNEYLLKGMLNKSSAGTSAEVHAMIQNIFMYSAAILVNGLVLTYTGEIAGALTSESLQSINHWPVIALIFNNAAVGIVTSLFLKYLNSVLKTFASGLELMFTAVLTWVFWGIAINLQTVVAILVVTLAIYIYSLQPVRNPTPAVEEPRKGTA